MKSLHNIEKSGFHKGQYVGYANGAWRIRRDGKLWRVTPQTSNGGSGFARRTLAEVSAHLAAMPAYLAAMPAPASGDLLPLIDWNSQWKAK